MTDRRVNPLVFVVDDEPIIASTMAMILKSNGLETTSFNDPLEALRAAHFRTPDLLVSDVTMPFLSGVELAAKIKAFCPDCKVLLFSGQANVFDHFMYDSPRQERFEILQKPVHPAVLLQRIEALLDSPSVVASPRLTDLNSAPKPSTQAWLTSHRAYKNP